MREIRKQLVEILEQLRTLHTDLAKKNSVTQHIVSEVIEQICYIRGNIDGTHPDD